MVATLFGGSGFDAQQRTGGGSELTGGFSGNTCRVLLSPGGRLLGVTGPHLLILGRGHRMKENDMEEVGAALKNLRQKKGWSARELADRAGTTRSVIANIESNRKSSLSVDELIRLADALGCHPADIDARLDPEGFVAKARKFDAIAATFDGAFDRTYVRGTDG